MDIEISIIFVNYHTSGLIKDSLVSLSEWVKDISYEVIVVDNNTEKYLEEKLSGILTDIPFKYVYLEENMGYGRANNEGARYARGKKIFLLNPDTILLNNAVKILSDFLDSHPHAGVCGGNLTNADDEPVFSFRKIYPGITWEFEELSHNLFSHPLNPKKRYHNFSGRPMKVAYVSGANLMTWTELYRKCGGFSDDIFMYWDDVELCKKIKDLGYGVYSVPQARICHLESRSFENINLKNTFKIELQEKYRFVYLKRNIGKFKTDIADLFYRLFLDSRILFLPEGNKKEYYKIRKEFFRKFKKQ